MKNDEGAQLAPYPDDTRAKGWRFELDHERIKQSDTWALAPANVRPWLLMLWMTAWEQTPCGSLPSDDDLIVARLGIDPEFFASNRAKIMRGWTVASNGRLYHPVVSQRVLEMMESRRKDAARKGKQRGPKTDSKRIPTGVTRDTARSHDTGTSTSTGNTTPYGVGGKPPPETPHSLPTDRDMVFALGVPLLTAASVSDKNARSMLAALSKKHGEAAVVQALEQTALDRPIEPVGWLQALLKPVAERAAMPNKQEALEAGNRAVVARMIEKERPNESD